MHHDFAAIYQGYLTAPIEAHDDTMKSMVDALTRMLVKMHNENLAIEATSKGGSMLHSLFYFKKYLRNDAFMWGDVKHRK